MALDDKNDMVKISTEPSELIKYIEEISEFSLINTEILMDEIISAYREAIRDEVRKLGRMEVVGVKQIYTYCLECKEEQNATTIRAEAMEERYRDLLGRPPSLNIMFGFYAKAGLLMNFTKMLNRLLLLCSFGLAYLLEWLIRTYILVNSTGLEHYQPIVGTAIVWFIGQLILGEFPKKFNHSIWWAIYFYIKPHMINNLKKAEHCRQDWEEKIDIAVNQVCV